MPYHGVPRADILRLLGEGHSNKYVGRMLHASPRRIGQIRREEGLPPTERAQALTVEQKWASRVQPVEDGHVRWTGALRGSTPNLVSRNRHYSARRVAFRIGHGREPVGRVVPGCGVSWCVAPEHATDAVVRRADAAYRRIFGDTA